MKPLIVDSIKEGEEFEYHGSVIVLNSIECDAQVKILGGDLHIKGSVERNAVITVESALSVPEGNPSLVQSNLQGISLPGLSIGHVSKSIHIESLKVDGEQVGKDISIKRLGNILIEGNVGKNVTITCDLNVEIKGTKAENVKICKPTKISTNMPSTFFAQEVDECKHNKDSQEVKSSICKIM